MQSAVERAVRETGERAAQLNELRKTGTDPLCSVASIVQGEEKPN